MNTNTFFSEKKTFWNPLDLAATVNKTSSYENLSLEDKLVRLETSLKDIQKSIPDTNECKKVFFDCINDYIENNSNESNKDFYDESPYFSQNDKIIDMMKTLVWINHTDEMKRKILDQELNNYFS
tara:strand:- start:98 stop:472 length:375 start_codon:yes stop_codon:yes gene_type:complete